MKRIKIDKTVRNQTTEKLINDIKEALDFLNGIDGYEEKHRRVTKRALEYLLLDTIEEFEKHESLANDGKPWKPQELESLEKTLQRKRAPETWAEERDIVNMLSLRLKRSASSVRRKCVELGLGDKVDYWLAKNESNLRNSANE